MAKSRCQVVLVCVVHVFSYYSKVSFNKFVGINNNHIEFSLDVLNLFKVILIHMP